MAGRKLTILPLKRKIELIEAVESGKKQKIVADEFKIPANSVSTIMKRKEHYKQQFFSGQVDATKQRVRLANHDDVESELLRWFTEMRGNNIPIDGPMMKTKATSIAHALGKDWECNEGWLSRFKHRRNIVFKTLCGESSAVDDVALDQWRDSALKTTLAKYQPSDVYNADETGLFWRLLPSKTFHFKGQACHGGKAPKDRITVLTCASMDGSHKLPLLVIGKFKTPRCFKGVRKLPVEYEANAKAWMTGTLFTEWLQEFDKMMLRQKRKVLLTLDNCTAHPKIQNLKAVELLFLPPNTTSKAQPCDMGIISNLKCHYRGTMLRRLINFIDDGNDYSTFKFTLLDAVVLLKQAWEKVEPATIRNCFRKAGFRATDAADESTEEIQPLLASLLAEYGMSDQPDDIENLDLEVPTAPAPSEDVDVCQTSEPEKEEQDPEEDDQGEEMPPISEENVSSALKTLSQYFMQKGIADDLLGKLQKSIDCHKVKRQKQTSLTSFFKPAP